MRICSSSWSNVNFGKMIRSRALSIACSVGGLHLPSKNCSTPTALNRTAGSRRKMFCKSRWKNVIKSKSLNFSKFRHSIVNRLALCMHSRGHKRLQRAHLAFACIRKIFWFSHSISHTCRTRLALCMHSQGHKRLQCKSRALHALKNIWFYNPSNNFVCFHTNFTASKSPVRG